MSKQAMTAVLAVAALTACPSPKPENEEAPEPSSPAPSSPASAPASAPSSAPAEHSSLKGRTPESRDDIDADGIVRRGLPVAHEEAMTVAALAESASDLAGKRVTVTGEVTEVCVKKGCWMAIRGEGPKAQTIRITSKGYAYFVPKDAAGMHATVTGELAVETMDEATARHIAEEAGKDPDTVEVSLSEFAIASVGLELRR